MAHRSMQQASAAGVSGQAVGTPPPAPAVVGDPAVAKMRKEMFLATLAQEPLQKWNQIRWCSSPAEAARLARQQRKPLFIEMIVGRMGRAESGVC